MEIKSEHISTIIANAKAGKQSAFRYLMDHYWNEVYGFQLKRIKDEYEAEDIAIETFAKAFDKIDTFDESYKFGTWLVSISKNIQIDKSRKKNASIYINKTKTSEDQIKKIIDDAPTAEDILIREQHLEALLSFIKQLKPQYQEIINLRYFQEMSYNEIATKLEEPLNNVKVRLLRAKKLLAEIIKKKEQSF